MKNKFQSERSIPLGGEGGGGVEGCLPGKAGYPSQFTRDSRKLHSTEGDFITGRNMPV